MLEDLSLDKEESVMLREKVCHSWDCTELMLNLIGHQEKEEAGAHPREYDDSFWHQL